MQYPFQSQKSRSCGSFSRLEMSAGSINQASTKFKNQLVQLINFSSAHHIILSIEDRVDIHSWLKPPHKCMQTTQTCSLHQYISTVTIFVLFFLTVESLDESFFNANHFDVTRSKCCQTKPIVWATLLILMSRHADRS